MARLDTLPHYVDHWAQVRGDALSQRFLDVDGRELERYTFGSFAERTRELAAYLSREVRLRPGDRVLLVYPPGLELNVAFVACARIGVIPAPVGAPLPSNLDAGLAKIAYIVRDSGARAILSARALHQGYQLLVASRRKLRGVDLGALDGLPWIATEESRGFGGAPVDDTPGPTLFLQYTSGSTSDPKGVVVSHENVIRNGHVTIGQGHTAVSWLPQHHDMGFIGYYLYLLLTGQATHGFSPADFLQRPALWFRLLSEVRGSHTSAPNFAYDYCLRLDKLPDAELEGLDLSCVKRMATAAEPIRAATVERFLDRFERYGLDRGALLGAYGLAEFTLSVAYGGRQVLTLNKQALQQREVRIEKNAPSNNNQVRLVSCGRALDEVEIRIVSPDTHEDLGEDRIGEIWLQGNGKTGGYWQRPELTEVAFGARIAGRDGTWLRTGDLGFVHEGDLFVCGRIKDMIIVRGVNYYPQDVEALVEAVCPEVRTGCVAAFAVDDQGDDAESMVVVAELRDTTRIPDPEPIARALRARYYVEGATVALVPPRTVPKTTSGKVSRHRARAMWEAGEVRVLARTTPAEAREAAPPSRFGYLKTLYGLTGEETLPLVDVGVDSVVLVQLIGDVKAMLAEHGAAHLADAVDTRLVQRLTVADLFGLVARFEADPAGTIASLGGMLEAIRGEYDAYEAARMRADAEIALPAPPRGARTGGVPLLTGATGFLGPFLVRALLRHWRGPVRLVVRAGTPGHGMDRVVASMARARILTPAIEADLRARAEIVCGDLALPRLGLAERAWTALARDTSDVFHNGALVNYVMSYDALRVANVEGTRTMLELASVGRATFHHVSSTFIYGWATKPIVDEADRNDEMGHLDFGYSQTKWVAEQQVYAAARQGLDVRVYRPSLIAPTAAGFGSRDDVLLRLLAFQIEHGLGILSRNQVSLLPADLVADHIVGLSGLPGETEPTWNLTTDFYYNLEHLTRRMTELYGFEFDYLDIPSFVVEMNRRCTPKDALYPLVDFFTRSHKKLLAMQDKRYDNRHYRAARARLEGAGEEPPFDATVRNLVSFMRESKLISR